MRISDWSSDVCSSDLLPPGLRVETLVPPAFAGMLLAVTCLFQFSVSILIERRYEKRLGRALYWVVWYPAIYWMLSLFTTLASYPKVFVKTDRDRKSTRLNSSH